MIKFITNLGFALNSIAFNMAAGFPPVDSSLIKPLPWFHGGCIVYDLAANNPRVFHCFDNSGQNFVFYSKSIALYS